MEQTVNPGTEARAEGAATLTQADLDRVVQQTIARERRRAEAALEAARAEAGRAERERLEAGMAQRERDVARRELAAHAREALAARGLPGELAGVLDYSGQEEAYVRAAMYGTDDYDNVMDPSPDPNKNAVLKFYDTLKNIGEIDKATAYSMDDYVVTSIYRTALDTLLEREPDEQLWKDLDQAYAKNNE